MQVRMKVIADSSCSVADCSGEPIPCVDYSAEETRVWGHVLDTLVDLYPTHACKEYNDCYKLFNFKPDRIPQLEEVSEVR